MFEIKNHWCLRALALACVVTMLIFAGCGDESSTRITRPGDDTGQIADDVGLDAADDVGLDAADDAGDRDTGEIIPDVGVPDVGGEDHNHCDGIGPLFYEGEISIPGQVCGVCEDGELACDGPDALVCQGASALNACGSCGELEAVPAEECGLGAVWTCDNGGLVCLPEGGQNACGGTEVLDSSPGDACGPCGLDALSCDGQNAVTCNGETACPELEVQTEEAAAITANSATLEGTLSQLGLEPATDHGFCWSVTVEPGVDNGECVSLDEPTEIGAFSHDVAGLEPGRTYYVRAYVTAGERVYGNEITFTTFAPAPGGLTATQGDHGDRVALAWDVASGATEYIVYRDGVEITRVGATSAADMGASAAPLPSAPTLTASQGSHTGFVRLNWTAAVTPNGASHAYTVAAVYTDSTSLDSAPATGYRAALAVTAYELERSGGGWMNLGDVIAYDDADAPAGQIAPGVAAATNGEFETHVALSVAGAGTTPGAEASYQVRALTEAGAGAASSAVTGYRGIGTLFYQWQRSATDADEDYAALAGATTSTHDDNTAPADGAGRYYRVELSADGAAPATSTADRGFRAALATVVTNAMSQITPIQARARGNLTSVGAPAPTSHGFCWDTSPNPALVGSALCNDLGPRDQTGIFNYIVTGLTPGNRYYLRAYATNSAGTVYANQVEFATPLAAPTGLVASDGTSTDHVALSWNAVSGAIGYEIQIDGGGWIDVGNVVTFEDSTAPQGTIDAGIVSATDGTFADRVDLEVTGISTSPGASVTYRVRAVSANGGGLESTTATGYRGVGATAIQWERSAADSDANYTTLAGATTAQHSDTTAPLDGSARYYRVVVTAAGASAATSAADRGYRDSCGTVMAGPTLTNNIGGWGEAGMRFVAQQNITLQSVVFHNQGGADEIRLLSAAGAILQTHTVPSGQPTYTANVNWNLNAGQTYRLVAREASNGRWVDYSGYPTNNAHLSMQGVVNNMGTLHTQYWFHFRDLRTCPR